MSLTADPQGEYNILKYSYYISHYLVTEFYMGSVSLSFTH